MAASAVHQELTDMVTCEICYELFEGRDPRGLPCFHSFCAECIQGVLDATRKRGPATTNDIACPICQSPTTIPGGSVTNLPAYFPSSKIQDAIKQLNERHSICKVCETTSHKSEVASYCFQCSTAMCSICKTKHDRRHKSHPQVKVTGSTVAYLVCAEHDICVDAFCTDCSQAVCSRCSFGTHSDHNMCDLSSDSSDVIDGLELIFKDKVSAADQAITKLTRLQGAFNTHMDKTTDELDKHHHDVIKQLQQQHISFRKQLQERRYQVNQDLDKSKALLCQDKDCIKRLQDQSESWRLPIPAVPDAMLTGIEHLIADIKKQMPSTDVPFSKTTRLVFVPTDRLSLGEITEQRSQTPKPEESQVAKSLCVQGDPRLVWSVSSGGVSGVDFLPSGDVITGGFPTGLHVYNQQTGREIQHPLSGRYTGVIQGVAVDGARSTVASVEYRFSGPGVLHVYTAGSGRWTHKECKICKVPCSVVCTRDGQVIVGGGGKSVYKYNIRGRQIWETKLSFYLGYITTDNKDRILVSDTDGGCIRVYNQDGVEISFFPAATDQRKLTPRGICVDSMGNILVGDIHSKTVLLYDDRGNYIRDILHVDGEPQYVALYQDKYLTLSVCKDGKHTLSLYEL